MSCSKVDQLGYEHDREPAMSNYPAKLDKIIHLFEALPEQERRETLVSYAEGAKNQELVKEYKIPLDKGVPAVAVLDLDGKLLYSSGEGEFEAARRMLKKDLVIFLKRWAPIPSPSVLSND